MDRVVVVVPVYKTQLSELENVSLTQLYRILYNYPIVFVMPNKLKGYFDDNELEIRYFDDYYFTNRSSYSDLCLDENFYRSFDEYEYMMIYQLDAFVFEDKLLYFCELGYDYIGAPVYYPTWKDYHVGNGGLSIRKIDSILRVLSMKKDILVRMPEREKDSWEEDNFFGFCGYCKDIEFKVPSQRVASGFSLQHEFSFGYRSVNRAKLPFGCHGWYTSNYNIWKPIVETFGYSLPDESKVDFIVTTEKHYKNVVNFLFRRIIKHGVDINVFHALYGKNIYMWGAGFDGNICYLDLIAMRLCVTGIVDKNPANISNEYKCTKFAPDIFLKYVYRKRETIVIISSSKYKKEIEAELLESGLKKYIDFYSWDEMKMDVVLKKYGIEKGKK